MANSADPDEMAHYEPSHLDLHCLQSYLVWSARLKGFKIGIFVNKNITRNMFAFYRNLVKCIIFYHNHLGVVGWCEGAVYLISLGRPTDIGLQLGKACYPCSG